MRLHFSENVNLAERLICPQFGVCNIFLKVGLELHLSQIRVVDI